MTTALITDWKKQLITLVVFLFPVLTASVKDAGSIIFTLLLLMGLWFGRQGWQTLGKNEKRFFTGLLVLFAIIATGLFYTADLKEGLSKLERYLRIVLLIPVYLMFRRFDLKPGKVFLLGAMVAIPVLAIQGWYQTEIMGRHLAVGAYHKIVYGDMVVLFAAIVVVATITMAQSFKHYLIAATFVCLASYAAILSGTRAAWLFIPVLFITLLFIYRHTISKRAWGIVAGILFAFVIIVSVIQPGKLVNGLKSGWNDIQVYIKDPSAGTSWGIRLNMWRNSLIMASEAPLLGKGTGSYQAENQRLVEEGISYNKYVADYGHAHSIYFHTLAENGFTGVIVMVIVLFVLPFIFFYHGWLNAQRNTQGSEQRFYTLAGIISLVAFAWFGVSEGWLARNPFVNVYFMCMLVFMSSTAVLFKGQGTEEKA